MSGVSVEQMLGLWSAELGGLKARIRPLFAHPSVAASAAAFLDGLLGPERRKTGWMRAEAAGDPGPWRQQAVLGRSHWEADALRDLVRDYVVETLAAPDAVLVIDETGFLKQGNASCGVKRQYTGSAGKITNSLMFVVNVQDAVVRPPRGSSGSSRREAIAQRRGQGRQDDGWQTLMRGLATAFPCVLRPGLPRSASGRRRMSVGHTIGPRVPHRDPASGAAQQWMLID